MIITCEECSTKFNLDDERIPENGIRVRCSRCQHAFFVKRPGTSWDVEATDPSDFFEREVEQTLTGEADGGPDEEAQSAPPAERASAAPGAGESPFDDGDWEFNDDNPFGESTVEPKDTTGVPDDFDADAGENSDVFGEAGVLGAEADPASAPEPKGGAPETDLGSPESWDIVGEETSPAQAAAAPARPPEPTPILLRRRAARTPVALGPVRARLGPVGRAAHAAGWIAVVVLFAAGLYASLWPQPSTPTYVASIGNLAGLQALDVEGRWLENAIAGPIYVISGELANPGTSQVVPGARLAVRLLDDQGVAIAEESAALGPPLSRRQLRETHPRELRALHADGALRLAWAPVPAGQRRPFQAVLTDVPMEAGRFELHAIPIEESAPVPQDLLSPGLAGPPA